jgi:hypothetical protein
MICALVGAIETRHAQSVLGRPFSDSNVFKRIGYLTSVRLFGELGAKVEGLLGNLSALPRNFASFVQRLVTVSCKPTPPALPVSETAPTPSDTLLAAVSADAARLEENFRHPEAFGEHDVLIAFFGGTGSGKSSVIKALLGEDHPDFSGVIAGNAAGTTSRPLAIPWRKTAGGHMVWLVDVPGHGQPTRMGRGGPQVDSEQCEEATLVLDTKNAAKRIQAEIDNVYPRVHLAISVIRGMQPQLPFQEWNDHCRERFPREKHVVLFNGQRADPTATQWSKAVFEQEFDRLKKTYTGPLKAGEPLSIDWYCDVPGYDFRIDRDHATAIRKKQDVSDVRTKLLAFADEHGPAALTEAAKNGEMEKVVEVLKETAWTGGVCGGLAGGIAVLGGPVAGVAVGLGYAGLKYKSHLWPQRPTQNQASAEGGTSESTPPASAVVEGDEAREK